MLTTKPYTIERQVTTVLQKERESVSPRHSKRKNIKFHLRLLRRRSFRWTRSFVFWGFRLWLRKIHNPEKLPKQGPALIISNHVSYFDWAVLSSVLRKRAVFVGAKELLTRPIVRWLMKLNTLIYIDRENPGITFFKEVINQLKEEEQIVVIYPEGQRSRNGTRQRAKLGFVKLALATNTPIVPVGMKDTYKILPPHKWVPRLKRCEIFVGDPIFVTPEANLFKDIFTRIADRRILGDDVLQEMAERVMDRIAGMLGPEWDAGILQQRKNRLARTENQKDVQSAAIFDVDRTLVKGQTQRDLAIFLRKKKMVSPAWLARSLTDSLLISAGLRDDTKELRESSYSVFRNYSFEIWNEVFNDFFQQVVKRKVYKSALELIEYHRKQGHRIILLSASLQEVLLKLKKYVGADHCIGTVLEKNCSGYTGRIKGVIMSGYAKAEALNNVVNECGIDLTESYGYSDGFNDMRWLRRVGHPIIVNPDRKLRLIVKRKRWNVVQFTRCDKR